VGLQNTKQVATIHCRPQTQAGGRHEGRQQQQQQAKPAPQSVVRSNTQHSTCSTRVLPLSHLPPQEELIVEKRSKPPGYAAYCVGPDTTGRGGESWLGGGVALAAGCLGLGGWGKWAALAWPGWRAQSRCCPLLVGATPNDAPHVWSLPIFRSLLLPLPLQ